MARLVGHAIPLIVLLFLPALAPTGDGAVARQLDQQEDTAILTPTRLWGSAPLHPPLPPGCQPEEVLQGLQDFLRAVNEGDSTQLAANISELWLYLDRTQGPNVVTSSQDHLRAYFAERHDHQLVMQLTSLKILGPGDPPGTVWFSLALERHSNDRSLESLGGKGGIVCESGHLYMLALWSSSR